MSSEPTLVPYRTRYRGKEIKIIASDAYNAAVGRARHDTGLCWKWVGLRCGRLIVQRGHNTRTIQIL